MHQSKLVGVLENLGFPNVQAVISSGNVIFESNSTDIKALEDKLEKAWVEQLGFDRATIIRSQEQLQSLVDQDPYKGVEHSRKSYQLVTFFKHDPNKELATRPDFYSVKGVNALCSSLDVTTAKTPDFMSKLERQYGKDITSRTWLTLQRILKKME
jgi:uncharacterized protein (DUF1697 family)